MNDDDLKRLATRILEQVGFKASCYGNQVCWFGHDTNLCTDDEMMKRCLDIIKEELGLNRSGHVCAQVWDYSTCEYITLSGNERAT